MSDQDSVTVPDQLRDIARLIDGGHMRVNSIDVDVREDVLFLADDVDTQIMGFDLELSVSRVPNDTDNSDND